MKARPEFAGKPVKCPACGAVLVIPAPEQETGPVAVASPPAPAPTAGAADVAGNSSPWLAEEVHESSDALDLPWLRAEDSAGGGAGAPGAPQPQVGSTQFPAFQVAQSPSVKPDKQEKPSPAKPPTSPRLEATAKSASVQPQTPAQKPPSAAAAQKPAVAPAPVANAEPAPTYAVITPAEPGVELPNIIVEEPEPLSPRAAKAAAATGSEDEAMPKVSREPWYVPFVETMARFLLAAGVVCCVAVPALLLIGGLISVVKTGDPRAFLGYQLGPFPVAYSLLGLLAALAGLALLWAAPMLIVLDLSRRLRVLSRRLDTLSTKPQIDPDGKKD